MHANLTGGAAGHSYRLLFDPAPVEGGGNTPPPVKEPETPLPTPAADPIEGFKVALGKHNNDALSLARESFSTAESLRTQLAETRAKLPKEGSVILAGDDVAAWEAFRALGKPDEIKATIAEHGTLKTQIAQRARQDLYGEISKSHGWNPAALADVPGIDEMDLIVKDGTRNGKPAKIAHLRETVKEGDKEIVKETPLDAHIQKTRPHLMPALTAGQAAGTSRTQGGPARQPQKPAVNPGAETAQSTRPRSLARW